MKMNRLKSHLPEIFIFFLTLLCALVILLIHKNPGFNRYAVAASPFYMLEPDEVTEEVIPDYAGLKRNYTFTIPDTLSVTTTGSRLLFFLRHTIAHFYIEDSTLDNDLSEDSAPHIGHTPGNYWVSLPMRAVFAGKKMRIELIPVFPSVRDLKPEFMVITRDMLISMIELPKALPLLILSIFAVFAGIFLSILSFFVPLLQNDRWRIFYLGAVSTLVGLWKICGFSAVLLMMDYLGLHKEIWFVGAISYLMMMVLSMRLLVSLREKPNDRPGLICFNLSAAIVFLIIVLQMAGLLEIHETLVFFGAGMVVLHLVSLFSQKPSLKELFWLLPFSLSIAADLIIYLSTGTMQNAPVFLFWVAANLFIRCFSFVREAVKRERVLIAKEAELRSTRTQAMINQIRPHFIYNTLVSVYMLLKDDPEKAGNVISDFTNYLQSNFSAIAATNPISFGDELKHTRSYLAVESVLYGEKLSVVYDTEYTAFRLPPSRCSR